jgi:hypothetical protein
MNNLAYGQLDPGGFYQKLQQRADGYPDKSGRMTAISSAINVSAVQVFLESGQTNNAQSQ